ncbi:MAG: hypothetical protein KAJ63_10535 [Methyloprofundus sp.]|nr:hypothetical protein [Methyloprofundus sp.]
MNRIKGFLKKEDGAETLEYVVIVAIILVLAAAVYNTSFTGVLSTVFDTLNSAEVAPDP